VEKPASGEDASAAGPPEGVSAFIAKVLDQLSLSSWLPATFFAAATALLAEFRSQRSLSISKAINALTDDYKQILILFIPVLILATILTQAFSYASIRALEGYWWRRGPTASLRTAMIWRHARKREKYFTLRQAAVKHALAAVEEDLMARYSDLVIGALKRQALGQSVPTLSGADKDDYDNTSWDALCHPWDLARVEHFERREEDYPLLPRRTLPTKLGNVLRSTEDRLIHAGGDVGGFVLRQRAKAPPRVRIMHDQFRNRLDMYCTMVFVSIVLTFATIGLLAGRQIPTWQWVLVALGFVLFACASYGSAVASARGYGSALRAIDAAVGETTSSTP